jgi:hypothetical protein
MAYAKYEMKKHGTITKDGHVMHYEDIVKDLNRKSHLERKLDLEEEAFEEERTRELEEEEIAIRSVTHEMELDACDQLLEGREI